MKCFSHFPDRQFQFGGMLIIMGITYPMLTIIQYLRDYAKEEWNARLFSSVFFLLIAAFVFNYGFISESRIIRHVHHPLLQFVFYFFYYGVPFIITLLLYSWATGKKSFLKEGNFLFLTAFAMILLACYVTLHNLPSYLLKTEPGVFQTIPAEYHWYTIRYSSNLLPGFAILIPFAWYWVKHDKETSHFYGFSASNIKLSTYFGIILALLPIVVAASYGTDFQGAYPRFKFGLPMPESGVQRILLIGGFEVCYGVDFVFVELVFRGFMVMAFARYLGSASILPMVVVYAFIHFQKPLGEALGSIIGGFVLGVIAYRTKSIYGGVILHLGIAYLMELAGLLHM